MPGNANIRQIDEVENLKFSGVSIVLELEL